MSVCNKRTPTVVASITARGRAAAGTNHDFDYPGIKLHEEPGYRTTSGVIPIVGPDPAAREDALARVPTFLARYPLD
jgi:hypothetical protein